MLQRRADGPPGPGVQHGRQAGTSRRRSGAAQARSAQSAMSSCVISCVLDTRSTASPCPRSLRHNGPGQEGVPVVRKEGLYTPNSCGFLGQKRSKTAKFRPKKACHQRSHRFVTAPFLEQKALKTANSEKCVFRVLRRMCCLGLQIRLFSAENRLQVFAVLQHGSPLN